MRVDICVNHFISFNLDEKYAYMAGDPINWTPEEKSSYREDKKEVARLVENFVGLRFYHPNIEGDYITAVYDPRGDAIIEY